MVIIPPQNHIPPQPTKNLRALSSSALLHGLLALWIFVSTFQTETMPQQIVQVSLVAAAPAELAKYFTEQEITQPQQPIIKDIQEKEQYPQTEKAPTHTQKKQEPVQPKRKQNPLSSLTPAAGKSTTAKETAQVSTTAPIFDANYLKNPAPEYPTQARRRNIQGSVLLSVIVKEDGTAKMVSIASSSGFTLLDDSAKSAVSRWKFVPAKRGGEAVEAHVIVPIDFKLN